tara:strand:- start:12285 stop:12557 length:273 start_codon:yes stop_codon:yes gene_type:complete
MKTIKLPCHGIVVKVGSGSPASCVITSDLKEDPSVAIADSERQDIEAFNSCMDVVESMILGHAFAGIDISSPAYLEGIESTVEKFANLYS